MRKFLAVSMLSLAVLVAGQSGCNSCRQMTRGWFNHGDRGDRCDPYPQQPDCQPGMPRAQVMYPGTTTVLPGQIEVAPLPQ